MQIGVLLVMAGLTRWLLLVVQDGDEDRQVLPDARSDYTLEEFNLLVMNRQGDPSFRIESPYLEKNPVDESVSLSQPLVYLFDGGQQSWRINAEEGWIQADGDEIELRGRVVLGREFPGQLTIRTQNLRIYPNEDRAYTDQAVKIDRPGAELNGVGLEAWLDSERIEILSKVKGHYEPPKS
jgi:lipopolysaccharide export system protein LptC